MPDSVTPDRVIPERRRFPRMPVEFGRQQLRTSRHIRVRLVDLSASGALLEAQDALAPGTRGRLRLALRGATFEAPVEVTRQVSTVDGEGRVAAVTMTGMPAAQQYLLDEFLRRAGS